MAQMYHHMCGMMTQIRSQTVPILPLDPEAEVGSVICTWNWPAERR